jgi:trk system potassium uptake protein TrkH
LSREPSELRYAVRFRVVRKYLGQLLLIVAALTLVPFFFSLVVGEHHISLRYALVIGVVVALGFILSRSPRVYEVQANEALVLAAVIFFLAPVAMAFVFMASGLSFMDALFEAISAATTTGLTTLANVENEPWTFLFARAWMQWYGGLGIVVLSLALVLAPGIEAKSLAVTEEQTEDLIGGTKAHTRRVLVVYGLLTGIGIFLILVSTGNPFNALVYTMAAVSTGGFAPYNNSLPGLGPEWVQALVIFLSVAGAVSLPLFHQAYRRGWRLLFGDLQVQALVACGLLATILLAFCLRLGNQAPWADVWYQAPLMAFSAQSTAGFSTSDPSQFCGAAKMVLIGAMLIGGSLGSTAGGIKVLRLLVLLQILRLMLVRSSLPPHAVMEPHLGGRVLRAEEIQQAFLIIFLFVLVVGISWFIFVAADYQALDALFEVVSATGTVGLSAGLSSGGLPDYLKTVLCADMLLGRLEIVAWMVIFYPKTWIGRRLETS